MKITVRDLKHHAFASTLFRRRHWAEPSPDLGLRSKQIPSGRLPAAQDLILRHRVTDYRVDEINVIHSLKLEETSSYAYGLCLWNVAVLHPECSGR